MNTETIGQTATIHLDETSIDPAELSISTLTREISLQARPHRLLVKMMNALERKRQQKGFGWSRSWNKYGLTVFRSHTASMSKDRDYVAPVRPFLESFLGKMEEPYGSFIDDLLEDPSCMVFTFYHNHQSEDDQFEGLTLSFGRKVKLDTTKRDRLDIVLEDRRVNGAVDRDVNRVRVYICPWERYENKEFHLSEAATLSPVQYEAAQTLYEHAVTYYHQWKGEENRQWSHWSTRYIDYFGPREFIPQGSSFT